MSGRKLKLALGVAAVGATAAFATPVLAVTVVDNDDNVTPASTPITESLQSGTTFSVSGTVAGTSVMASCTSSTISGSTRAHGLNFTIAPPTFGGCSDNLGGTDTVAASGTWRLLFHDAANDETAEAVGDSLILTIPQSGITVSSNSFPGCTITIDPSGHSALNVPYDDVSTWKISNKTVPSSTSAGCPGGATTGTATLNATYVSSPGFSDGS